MTQPPPLTIVSAQRKKRFPAYLRRTHSSLVDLSTPHTGRENESDPPGDFSMKSVMKRAAGGVALTMVLIRGFCGGGSFFGLLRNRRPSLIVKVFFSYLHFKTFRKNPY